MPSFHAFAPQQVQFDPLSLSLIVYWEVSCPDRSWREHNYSFVGSSSWCKQSQAWAPPLVILFSFPSWSSCHLVWCRFFQILSTISHFIHCELKVVLIKIYQWHLAAPGWDFLSISNIFVLMSWSIHIVEGDKSELSYELYLRFSPDKCIKREYSWISEYIVWLCRELQCEHYKSCYYFNYEAAVAC